MNEIIRKLTGGELFFLLLAGVIVTGSMGTALARSLGRIGRGKAKAIPPPPAPEEKSP